MAISALHVGVCECVTLRVTLKIWNTKRGKSWQAVHFAI